MNPAIFQYLALAVYIVGAVAAVVLLIVAVNSLQRARTGAYYVVREEARSRGWRLLGLALALVPVTVGLGALLNSFARPVPQVQATATAPDSATPVARGRQSHFPQREPTPPRSFSPS